MAETDNDVPAFSTPFDAYVGFVHNPSGFYVSPNRAMDNLAIDWRQPFRLSRGVTLIQILQMEESLAKLEGAGRLDELVWPPRLNSEVAVGLGATRAEPGKWRWGRAIVFTYRLDEGCQQQRVDVLLIDSGEMVKDVSFERVRRLPSDPRFWLPQLSRKFRLVDLAPLGENRGEDATWSEAATLMLGSVLRAAEAITARIDRVSGADLLLDGDLLVELPANWPSTLRRFRSNSTNNQLF